MTYGRCIALGAGRGLGVVAGVLVLLGVMVGDCMANMTISTPEIDMAQMGSYGTVILAALAGIWLVRKFIKVSNRS